MAETNLGRISVQRPFIDGYVSDLPAEALGPQMAARLENMIFPEGVARRRRGWVSISDRTKQAGEIPTGVISVAFQRVAAKRVVASFNTSTLVNLLVYVSTNTWAGPVQQFARGTVALPRAVYRDEVLYCSQNGVDPIKRYGGSYAFTTTTFTAGSYASGERRLTSLTPLTPSGIDVGGFFIVSGPILTSVSPAYTLSSPLYHLRLTDALPGNSQVSVERLRWNASGSVGSQTMGVTPFGVTAPCVDVYNSGTVTSPSGSTATLTGAGVDWNNADNLNIDDALQVIDSSGKSGLNKILSVPSSTTILMGSQGFATPSAYKVMRRMPFKDVNVFRGCLFGAGVKQHPSRLYYCPPGHDISLPPKYSDGSDVAIGASDPSFLSATPSADFEIPWVEVPSSSDANPIVALLPTDSALMVIKRSSVYRITGDYPYFRVDKAGDACGCVDIRSAIMDETGIYWAGDTGIWTLRGGQLFNLAGGPSRPGILNEWRNFTSEGFDPPSFSTTSRIVCGVAEGHLIVSAVTKSGTARTYVYDLHSQRWCGTFTNVSPFAMWSSNVSGETDKLYAMETSGAAAYALADYSLMFHTGAYGGPSQDTVASGANLRTDYFAKAWSGTSFFFPDSLEREHRLVDLDAAVRYSSTSTPTGAIGVTVSYGDAVDTQMDATSTVGTIPSDMTNAVRRNEFRPGTRGRRHQVRFEQTTVDADETALEIHEVGGFVRVMGPRR